MNLEKIRHRIDRIDYEILKYLGERMELTFRTKKFKSVIKDSEREAQIFSQVKRFSEMHNLIHPEFAEKLFKEIIRESRSLQRENKRLVGFQGEHGAFGEVAARKYAAELVPIPCAEFAEVFAGVDQGHFDLGIVPVQNSLGGAVSQVNELLIQSELKVVGAVKLRINHCLLVLPESNYREIREVFSHPQALSQCREFIQRQQLEPRPFYDTAGAARMLIQERPPMTAAIASKLCADIYKLEVIKENIEDHKSNFTRFLVLAKEESQNATDKCSIVFSTAHKSGALFAILKLFADAGINLTRIESFPYRDDPGRYVFFLDFHTEAVNGRVQEILKRVKKTTPMFKYLGCYFEKE